MLITNFKYKVNYNLLKTSISLTNLYYCGCKIYFCVPPAILYAFIQNLWKLSKTGQQ